MSSDRPARLGLLDRVPRSVRIVEVGPRDGLQNEPGTVSADAKVAFVEALAEAGLSHIEVTSFVSPRKVPQMQDASEVFRRIAKKPGVTYTALVPNEEGLRRAIEAGVQSIAVFTAATDTFNQKNIGCTIEESFARIRAVIASAASAGLKVRGYVSVAFTCPYEGLVPPSKSLEVIRRLRELGVPAISIGDTLGAAFPHQVDRLLEMVQAELGIEGIALHLHDTYRRALANALVGLQHGVEELDASAGGLGGCPFAPGARGNVATEELVAFLEGMGVATGVDVVKVQSASAALRAALH
ncbi:MAG TPA: hydroxymethylglutaryl-CoA lyase [Planctomycetota bacterium]|nr:hydroxymethylglutaryl-CoA lyase [Planctomycetota bacterium]